MEPEPTAFHVRFKYPDAGDGGACDPAARLALRRPERARSRRAGAGRPTISSGRSSKRRGTASRRRRSGCEAFRERHGNGCRRSCSRTSQAIQNAQLQVQAIGGSDRARPGSEADAGAPVSGGAERARAGRARQRPPRCRRSNRSPADASALRQQQLAAARALLASLEPRLTPEHPDIVRTKRLIAELEPKVAAEEANRAGRQQSDPASASQDALSGWRHARGSASARADAGRCKRRSKASTGRRSSRNPKNDGCARWSPNISGESRPVPGVESEWAVLTRDYETQQASYNRDLLTKSAASKVGSRSGEPADRRELPRRSIPARVPVNPVESEAIHDQRHRQLPWDSPFAIGIAGSPGVQGRQLPL